MGQAVALPDPLDAPPPQSGAGTDDLLAQLAGDEIDRMLAEADVERTPQPPPAPAPAPTPAPAAEPTTPATSATSAAPAAAAAVPAPAVANDELDTLLDQLSADVSGPVKDLQAALQDDDSGPQFADFSGNTRSLTEQVPEVLAQHALNVATTPVADALRPEKTKTPATPTDETLDGVMSPEEREALGLSNLVEATDAAERQDATAAAVAPASTGPAPAAAASVSAAAAPAGAPVTPDESVALKQPGGFGSPFIRLLEWINAPLSFIPDRARDPLGKVAVITILNSIAVVIYVLFVRR